ncbi:MAG: hypothetical protein O3A57_10565 [Bacteroidetes bacterium]|nr:hypothetical protein [Bacteroidota bacterium]
MKYFISIILLALIASVALFGCDFSPEATRSINDDTNNPVVSFEVGRDPEAIVAAKSDSPGLLIIENSIEVYRIQYRELAVGANRLVESESDWRELPFSTNAKGEIAIPLAQFRHSGTTESRFIEVAGFDDGGKKIFQSGSVIR